MPVSKSEILASLHQLPSMPTVVQEVLSSFKNDNLDSTTLAQLISRDQGLSARVLRVANSPFYGLPRKVSSMEDAVIVLGFGCVRSLVLAAGFMRAFPVAPGSLFDRNDYWKHSFRVAGYAKALAQGLRQDTQTAFIAGMFHDVGQLLLDVCIPEQFSKVLQQREISGLSLVEVEQSEFGFDHAVIGAEMARHWNFPPEIEHAIHYWRSPEQEPFKAITGMVHVAVLLENGLTRDNLISHLPKRLGERLQIRWDRIEAYLPAPDELDAGAGLMLAT